MIPQTQNYYVAAYVIAALIYAAYAYSIWRRARTVRDRLGEAVNGGGRDAG